MNSGSEVGDPQTISTALVIRSQVPVRSSYNEYKQELRYDFFYSCAYCCIAETEAGGMRFTIDHYEPQKARNDLVNVYDNLMWSCDVCNQRKGDRYPPVKARQNGFRFFRPDVDVHLEHFSLEGNILKHKTNIAYYTIESLDLNRESLQRVRDIRRRIYSCDEAVSGGVLALSRFPIDRLPTNIRGPAYRAIKQLVDTYETMADAVETALKSHARSPILDEDDSASERAKQRKEKLAALEGMFPGSWRGPRKVAKGKRGGNPPEPAPDSPTATRPHHNAPDRTMR
ncbi:HNH endonuclease [Rhizobium sp. Root482]|uniref:HNH endonuclease n=1 Tax=Rhizobium sp. Root482 TaxID=1736543 RepID=UPI000A79A7D2|nr:HNH endonuclease [Rhizobium sp. Root482]